MEGLTTVVKLPSKGKFNPDYAGDITLDMMGFEEEKIAFGASDDTAIDRILERCIVSPKPFDVSTLTPQDRRFLLIKLRIHTYGDEYHIPVDESGEVVEEKISLDDIPITELDDDFIIPEGTLPISQDLVKIKVLTVGERRKIDTYAKEKAEKFNKPFADVRYEALAAKRLDNVNGVKMSTTEALTYLHSLKARDLAYIRHLEEKVHFGYGSTVTVHCRDGVDREAFVRMTGEFFRPRFDD